MLCVCVCVDDHNFHLIYIWRTLAIIQTTLFINKYINSWDKLNRILTPNQDTLSWNECEKKNEWFLIRIGLNLTKYIYLLLLFFSCYMWMLSLDHLSPIKCRPGLRNFLWIYCRKFSASNDLKKTIHQMKMILVRRKYWPMYFIALQT